MTRAAPQKLERSGPSGGVHAFRDLFGKSPSAAPLFATIVMDRIIVPFVAVAGAALTAAVLDYIAHNDLGASHETIRVQALILAAIIGIGLVGSLVQEWRK